MEKLKVFLKKLYTKLERIARRFDIDTIRSVKVEEESRRNIMVTLAFLVFNLILLIMIYNNYYSESILGISFVIMLILVFLTSYMWNFRFCPEKMGLKKYVNIQHITRGLLIMNCWMFGLFKVDRVFICLMTIFTICDVVLSWIIKKESSKIVIAAGDYVCSKEISECELENYSTLSNYISGVGLILYFVSVSMLNVNFSAEGILMKILVFSLAIDRINRKLLNGYEDKKPYDRDVKIIDVSLVMGILVNIVGLVVINNFMNLDANTYKEACDLFVLIGMICLLPLGNRYASLAKRATEIRHYIQKNKLEDIYEV